METSNVKKNGEMMENKIEVIQKIVKQKKEIKAHLRDGGDIDDLDPNEYGFVKPNLRKTNDER